MSGERPLTWDEKEMVEAGLDKRKRLATENLKAFNEGHTFSWLKGKDKNEARTILEQDLQRVSELLDKVQSATRVLLV